MTLGCKTSKDVMKAVKEHGVQMVDVRFTETGGTGAGNLAYVLNAEGVPCYASTGVGNKLFDYCNYYLSERTAIIAHISWASGGGHFTVLSEIDSNQRLYFLDPWYDVVEVSRSSLPNYGVAGGTLSVTSNEHGTLIDASLPLENSRRRPATDPKRAATA